MKAALFIDLTIESTFQYENSFLSTLKEHLPDIQTLDLDSGSDPTLFSYSGNIIEEVEKAVLLIKVKEDSTARNLFKLIDTLVKNRKKVLVILDGKNPVLDKMLHYLKDNYLTDLKEEELLFRAIDFLKNGQ